MYTIIFKDNGTKVYSVHGTNLIRLLRKFYKVIGQKYTYTIRMQNRTQDVNKCK